VPRLSLGEAEVVVDIAKGVGDIKNFAATSTDGWLKIEGKIEFRDPFPNTLFPGCMRFKLSDALKQRAPDFGNIEYTLSEKVRQADGSFAIPTKGKLTELRWDVRRKCGGGSTEDDGAGDRPGMARPSLDVDSPTPGGIPVDPSQMPGVSDQPVDEAAAAAARAALENPIPGSEIPQPGASGPAMDNSQGLRDGGAGTAIPQVPPPPEVDPNVHNIVPTPEDPYQQQQQYQQQPPTPPYEQQFENQQPQPEPQAPEAQPETRDPEDRGVD
jgi:hypothetical protein